MDGDGWGDDGDHTRLTRRPCTATHRIRPCCDALAGGPFPREANLETSVFTECYSIVFALYGRLCLWEGVWGAWRASAVAMCTLALSLADPRHQP